jgi:hypothetical protein
LSAIEAVNDELTVPLTFEPDTYDAVCDVCTNDAVKANEAVAAFSANEAVAAVATVRLNEVPLPLVKVIVEAFTEAVTTAFGVDDAVAAVTANEAVATFNEPV